MKSELLKGYGIANTRNICCGHGDYRDVSSIETADIESNEYPPIFLHKEDAEIFLKEWSKTHSGCKIVEIPVLT